MDRCAVDLAGQAGGAPVRHSLGMRPGTAPAGWLGPCSPSRTSARAGRRPKTRPDDRLAHRHRGDPHPVRGRLEAARRARRHVGHGLHGGRLRRRHVFSRAREQPRREPRRELALVFLLFSDSTRIDLAGLRRHLSWPSRLLLVGLPLTMLAGLAAGLLVFPGMGLAGAFILSTMVCSTDAALGQRVVSDRSVPARVRQALDVESGLNDGLAVPFFLVAVDLSLAQLSTGVTAAVVRNMAEQIGWGLVAGVGVGVVAGLSLRAADD